MAELSAHDIGRSERLRAVTDNLFFWEGRRFIALGPVLMLVGLVANADWLDERIGNGLLAAALVAATYTSVRVGKSYRRELGTITPLPGAHVRRSRVKWLLVYPAMFGAMLVDIRYDLPLFVSGFVWAAAILLYRWSTGGSRNHYVVIAAALAGLGLAPLATTLMTGRDMVALMMVTLGAGFTAAAWLDDREMRAVLKGG